MGTSTPVDVMCNLPTSGTLHKKPFPAGLLGCQFEFVERDFDVIGPNLVRKLKEFIVVNYAQHTLACSFGHLRRRRFAAACPGTVSVPPRLSPLPAGGGGIFDRSERDFASASASARMLS